MLDSQMKKYTTFLLYINAYFKVNEYYNSIIKVEYNIFCLRIYWYFSHAE